MSDESSIQEKQQYLRTEIIEKGYNPSDFMAYLSDQREDGDDVENWGYTSLTDAVSAFVL